ncbi:MAG: DUF5690 family protein [Sphingomonadaceae bacterium]
MRERLERASPALFCTYAGLAAFAAYFSMYAFRKPFTAATFDQVAGWPFVLDYKIALIIAQVLGYALSKIIGIKLISELDPAGRSTTIIGLIVTAWIALLLFAIVPAPWNVFTLFFNGLALGLIWGLVFSYVEGRRTSDVIGAMLCATFIIASGVVKSVGKTLLDSGISAFWMPAATGALFFPLLLIAVVGLSHLPPPSIADRNARTARAPMDGAQRGAFFAKHWVALSALVIAYILITAMRDFRDNFAPEIWNDLGYKDIATLFTASELPVAAIALGALGGLMLVRDNLRALMLVHVVIAIGAVLIAVSTIAQQIGWLNPIAWMILSGAGIYAVYLPFNAMLFDRIIAATRDIGTAGFLIYVADSAGYVGSVTLLLIRHFSALTIPWLSFFQMTAYATSGLCLACVAISARQFGRLERVSRSSINLGG